jgi:hypothetical protein
MYKIYGVCQISEKLHGSHIIAVMHVGPLEGQSGAARSGQAVMYTIGGLYWLGYRPATTEPT